MPVISKAVALVLVASSSGANYASSAPGVAGYFQHGRTADQELKSAVAHAWKAFPGRTGIAILTPGANGLIEKRGNELFPQQSVSKIWVSLMIFDRVKAGTIKLDKKITVTRNDIAVFHQPLKKYLSKQSQFEMSVKELIEHSITASDNLANNVLLFRFGGPAAVRENLIRRGLKDIRFGPGEVQLQSSIAGLKWRDEYRSGDAFRVARSKIDLKQRRAALKRYLDDPIDGATPIGIVQALRVLNEEGSGSAGSALIDTMSRTFTGKRRLKSALPSRWTIAHKTGTGQVLGAVSTAINNVGVLSAPDGCEYYVAVMLADTTAKSPAINTFFGDVSRLITRHHQTIHPIMR